MNRSQPVERLDLACPEQRRLYEESFYRAFRQVASSRPLERIWIWDHAAGRLATRLPYAGREISVQRDTQGAISVAIAIHHDLTHLQAAAFGFRVPADTPPACEVLTLFAHDQHFATKGPFLRQVFGGLYLSGLAVAYATCAERLLRTYVRRFHATLLDQSHVDGEARYFLSCDLACYAT